MHDLVFASSLVSFPTTALRKFAILHFENYFQFLEWVTVLSSFDDFIHIVPIFRTFFPPITFGQLSHILLRLSETIFFFSFLEFFLEFTSPGPRCVLFCAYRMFCAYLFTNSSLLHGLIHFDSLQQPFQSIMLLIINLFLCMRKQAKKIK